MTELTATEKCSAGPVVFKNQTSVLETFENTFKISQEDTSGRSTTQETEDSQKSELKDVDEQTLCPPSAETFTSQYQWEVGSPCRTVWSEDGQVYPATVVCLDGGHCRVRFTGYGNEEDVKLSSLLSPEEAPPIPTPTSQDWRPGSRCRALYTEDGLIYPAVVLWVKGQWCRVRFDYYNNEEELDVSGLLSPDELQGPSRGRNKVSRRRGRRDESQREKGGGRGERRPSWMEDQQSLFTGQDKTKQSAAGKDAEMDLKENQSRQQPTNQSPTLLPLFPVPTQLSQRESIISPPPPPSAPSLWSADSKECGDSSSSMLMLWYMCGFHTGTYMTEQRLKSTTKD
ncbi:survival of motor neuron protein-like [Cynoglossus semilaevis]|uniref:survival of motor neuron protein-like n=1 Tax=Cynoglossus semilaevis TaxID=244447 RepID=UPI0004956B3C|nr:survival of motor neuron protein-like [Cynoglossus semilaevis]XP_016897741.1 survival of motor neuron protein-like [Cynoglossus semilaevis]